MSPYTVLIVEDEEELRRLVELHFKMNGWSVLLAENGRVALDILSHSRVDIVVSDVRMPVLDGLGLLRELRERRPALPVVLMTGHLDLTPEGARALGAQDLLQKPFEISRLVEQAAQLLTVRQAAPGSVK